MYNRYIPQPDGSFRRSQMPDSSQQPSQRPEQPRPQPVQQHCEPEEPSVCQPKQEIPPCRQGQPCPNRRPPNRQTNQRPQKSAECGESSFGVGSFLRNLLPRDFNTEDLLIVLLLLLMSGDRQEDQNTALLTLALYLFM